MIDTKNNQTPDILYSQFKINGVYYIQFELSAHETMQQIYASFK